MEFVAGIDPGKRGAVAFINYDLSCVEIHKIKDFQFTLQLFQKRKDALNLVVIEKQQAFPEQGVVSMFNLGKHYGMLLGMLETLSVPFKEVHPRTWLAVIKKSFFNKNKKQKIKNKKLIKKNNSNNNAFKKINSLKKINKEEHLIMAKELFPWLAEEIGRDHNKADALLIAFYARNLIVSKFIN